MPNKVLYLLRELGIEDRNLELCLEKVLRIAVPELLGFARKIGVCNPLDALSLLNDDLLKVLLLEKDVREVKLCICEVAKRVCGVKTLRLIEEVLGDEDYWG